MSKYRKNARFYNPGKSDMELVAHVHDSTGVMMVSYAGMMMYLLRDARTQPLVWWLVIGSLVLLIWASIVHSRASRLRRFFEDHAPQNLSDFPANTAHPTSP